VASIANDPNGAKRVLFSDKDGKRKTIRLGKLPIKMAREICGRVERILAAKLANVALDLDTVNWLSGVGDELHGKLAAVGLVQPRASAKLADFLQAYIHLRTDVKQRTRNNLNMAKSRLVAFFGPDKPLQEIGLADADDWNLWLKERYALATVSRTIKMARQFFKSAARRGLIGQNPFLDVKTNGETNEARKCFISRDGTAKVLEACPDDEYRLLVALSRYGGLRVPSEALALRWCDVNWEKDRFWVTSPKTEHHEGHEGRWVPIFPELRPYLEQSFDDAEEGAVYVIGTYRDPNKNFRTRFLKIVRRAGLTPWTKPFHNLRASRETELAAEHPLHVVCAWIGNTATIAQKHYLQVTDDYFERAAKGGAKSGAMAAQKAAQSPAASIRNHEQDSPEGELACEDVLTAANGCEVSEYAWRDSNPQPMAP
jgi:integrase